ncbi:transposase [Streptomyces sp. HU2014]|uniref:transposase n=1 Tax=Streptomyces sp. HU2014 TaxID=2939414 RepID=UPI0032C4322F
MFVWRRPRYSLRGRTARRLRNCCGSVSVPSTLASCRVRWRPAHSGQRGAGPKLSGALFGVRCRRDTTGDQGLRTAPAQGLRGRSVLLPARRTLQPDFAAPVSQCFRQYGQARRRTFTWTDFRDLLIAAHRQLDASLVLIWDNLNTHRAAVRSFAAEHDWITAFRLPPNAPDPNPVVGIWPLPRRISQPNTAFTEPDQFVQVVRRGIRMNQYSSNLIDGCLTVTGSQSQLTRHHVHKVSSCFRCTSGTDE